MSLIPCGLAFNAGGSLQRHLHLSPEGLIGGLQTQPVERLSPFLQAGAGVGVGAGVGAGVGVGVGAAVFLGAARILRIRELDAVLSLVRRSR